MIDDIFHATFHFEDPSGASSTGCYYQQTADNGSTTYDTFKLAEALEAALAGPITDMISDDFWLAGFRVRKVWEEPQNQYLLTSNPQVGQRSGPGLPSNNCALFNLNQTLFPIRSNGKMYWPGLPEVDTDAGVMEVAYHNSVVNALASALVAPVAAVGDTGVWNLGVISQKVLNLTPPTKDWAGAFAFVNSVSANPIIAIQRRRTTKVIGAVG